MAEFKYDDYSLLAIETIRNGKSLFITGKAGTGKTMLLKQIVKEFKSKRKLAVCAPTGVAANHAGGVTLHSFFKLPIGLYLPGHKMEGLFDLNATQIKTVKALQMLIIDEVSMVRCDTMDMIDKVLQHYRNNDKPFGGLQVVLIGDLRQLMPVVKEEEWDKLKKHYAASYFFCSKVMEKCALPMLELKTIHRQSDIDFVKLLNNLREGKLDHEDERILKTRYKPDFSPADSAHYIRLTTHRSKSYLMNNERLEILGGKAHNYKGFIEGFVPKQDFPADWVLTLKIGARVMFIANDNRNSLFFNGTLGTVVRLEDEIVVRTDEGKTITVTKHKWDFYSYRVNNTTKEVERILLGTFYQYPLRLAWAITIHKSQGLTFDRVVIDAGRAFTYGQVYVALSRCRKLAGMTLVSPVTKSSIEIDPVITQYLQSVKQIWPHQVLYNNEVTSSEAYTRGHFAEFISRTGYKPIGQLFEIAANGQLYDCWEDASGKFFVDMLQETENGICRISVGGYSEGSVPFEICSTREFWRIAEIRSFGGAMGITSIIDAEQVAHYNYRGFPIKGNLPMMEQSAPILNKTPKQRRYEFERTGDKIIIKKISDLSSSIPAVINSLSDLGKLILSCKSFKIMRNSTFEFHVGVEGKEFRVVKYAIDGAGLSVEARAIADHYYQKKPFSVKSNVNSTPIETSIKKKEVSKKTISQSTGVAHRPRYGAPSYNRNTAYSSPEENIVRYMKENGSCLARTIASALGMEKSAVNAILYGSLTTYGRVTHTGHVWTLKC